jgi:hypothetical protein
MLSELTMTNISSVKQVLVSGFESRSSFVQFFYVHTLRCILLPRLKRSVTVTAGQHKTLSIDRNLEETTQ